MSEDSSSTEKDSKLELKPNLAKDWNEDQFPTSAARVFWGWGLLLLGVVVLCVLVYQISEHEETESSTKKVNPKVSELMQDED